MPEPTIIAIGELLVEFVSHHKGCGLQKLVEYSGPYPSGAPAIAIDQAARMGANTQIFGSLGNDNFGNALIDRLKSNGVNSDAVLRHADKTTGVAFVSYFDDGSRQFIFHLTDTAADAVDNANFELPPGPLLLHVSGSSLGNPKLRLAIERVASSVLERGGKISCDPNARAELMQDEDARRALGRMIEKSSYLFPSTSDLEFLYPGRQESDVVNQFLTQSTEIVVVTRGADGADVYYQGKQIKLAPHSTEELDPTGAGDCFCGTFLAMIAQGRTPETAGRFANAAGALAVTQRGPMEGNSNLSTIEHFLEANPLTDSTEEN